MNISNLSPETLERLVKLAIETSPKSAALILLDNVVYSAPCAGWGIPEAPEAERAERRTLENFLRSIVDLYEKDRISAIREYRKFTGSGLKEAVDTVDILRGDVNSGCNTYYAYALERFAATGLVVTQDEFKKFANSW